VVFLLISYSGQNANTYVYYKNGGDVTQLGYCYQNQGSTSYCLADDGTSLTTVQGVYNCDNYSNEEDGVNPCT
jgi:hypothetical protein